MKISGKWTSIILACVAAVALVTGCSQPAAPATPITPPAAIRYDVGQGAELAKLSWYMSQGMLVVAVDVKNTTQAEKQYEVGVQVDNDPIFINAADATKVKAGATQTYLAQSVLKNTQPKTLFIKIAAK